MLLGCAPKDPLSTDVVFEYADNLEDAIGDFETSRTSVSENISQSTQKVQTLLSTQSPNIRQVTKEWERNWRDAKNEFLDLEKNFSMVGNTSKQYFDKLEEINQNIDDKKIQKTEKARDEKLKATWTKTFKVASQSIQKLSDIIKKGDDFNMILLSASLREKLIKNIDELKKIARISAVLLIKLEKLTIEGKKLIIK